MVEVSAWPPARFSAPLSDAPDSLFARYADALELAWRRAAGYGLDGWQQAVLHALTELYPEGHERAGQLRYRQVIIALGRQNGKTELAAALGLLFMLHVDGGYVVGIASTAEQARLVYRRAMRVISNNNALVKRFEALTETRGIRAKGGGQWELKAAKSAALQGIPIDLSITDEVHLVPKELWYDLLNGTGGRPNTLVVGITTAGDDNSELLKELYTNAEDSPDERFGYFIWESPEAVVPEDDETLAQYLRAANPALAAGRLDEANVMADVRAMPPADAIRYRLNRFVSATSSFISPDQWRACLRAADESFPEGRPVFAVDRTPDWSHASVVASIQDESGFVHSEVVASVVSPELDRLEALCVDLAAHRPACYAVDGYGLKELGSRLKRRGLPVLTLSQGDIVSASSMGFAKIRQRRLKAADDPLIMAQLPRTARKNVGTGFRVSRADSASQIDAIMATIMGIYVAETTPASDDQLFV